MTTIFEHNGKELYRDETDEYGTSEDNIEVIRQHFAQFDKTLLSATYTVVKPDKEGDPAKVIFAKQIGRKGSDASLVVGLLLTLPPAQLQALHLLHQFLGSGTPPNPAFLQLRAAEIEVAFNQATKFSERGQRIVESCLKLKPIPAQHPPLGF